MRVTTKLVATGVAVLTSLSLASCVGANGQETISPTASTSPSPSAPTPSPTPTPTPTPTGDEAKVEIAVRDFWAAVDRVAAEPDEPIKSLATVSRGETLNFWRQLLAKERVNGQRQIGSTKVTSVVVKADTTDWRATTCIDVSDVNVVDKDGKSVVTADRPTTWQYEMTLQEDDGVFYVVKDKAVGEC